MWSFSHVSVIHRTSGLRILVRIDISSTLLRIDRALRRMKFGRDLVGTGLLHFGIGTKLARLRFLGVIGFLCGFSILKLF